MCQALQLREADTWSLLSWSLYISQTYLFQINYSRLQKLLNKELGQEHVLQQQTGLNLANN